MNTPAEIYAEARAAGNIAVKGAVDGYPCGFATINIKPARGPFIKFLKEKGIGCKDDYRGGYTLSSYNCCNFGGQNMNVKEAGCVAFRDVLIQNHLEVDGYTINIHTQID